MRRIEVSDIEEPEDVSRERQLWCAVVSRALQDAMGAVAASGGSMEKARLRDDAREWFLRDGRDFRVACDAAGYDSEVIRQRALPLIGRTTHFAEPGEAAAPRRR